MTRQFWFTPRYSRLDLIAILVLASILRALYGAF